MSRYCNGCSGVIGVDCFNTRECEQIAANMNEVETADNWIRVEDVQAIYDKHKVFLDNMKENRAIENVSDADAAHIDELIRTLAHVLSDIHKVLPSPPKS